MNGMMDDFGGGINRMADDSGCRAKGMSMMMGMTMVSADGSSVGAIRRCGVGAICDGGVRQNYCQDDRKS
ncbi:MAG: hypothetical protein ACREQT_07385 [Candidatus Binataceae bacterium]